MASYIGEKLQVGYKKVISSKVKARKNGKLYRREVTSRLQVRYGRSKIFIIFVFRR